jgi:hypothetical protein
VPRRADEYSAFRIVRGPLATAAACIADEVRALDNGEVLHRIEQTEAVR